MGQDLPGSSHDPCRDRPSRPSRHDPRNECRQLSPERSCRQSARSGTSANARDNQRLILSVAPRQSNSPVTKISLALSSGRDNHPPAATAEMAILIVAVFPSRLSRNIYGFGLVIGYVASVAYKGAKCVVPDACLRVFKKLLGGVTRQGSSGGKDGDDPGPHFW